MAPVRDTNAAPPGGPSAGYDGHAAEPWAKVRWSLGHISVTDAFAVQFAPRHAAIWSVMALALMGDGEKAAGLSAMLNPIIHSLTPAAVARYKVEPYAALHIDPCIPKHWPSFEAAITWRSARYVITVDNPNGVSKGVASISLDGTSQHAAGPLTLADDGATHAVHVTLG